MQGRSGRSSQTRKSSQDLRQSADSGGPSSHGPRARQQRQPGTGPHRGSSASQGRESGGGR
eukprot:10219929-Heterocapsa_arctica.AAC.1